MIWGKECQTVEHVLMTALVAQTKSQQNSYPAHGEGRPYRAPPLTCALNYMQNQPSRFHLYNPNGRGHTALHQTSTFTSSASLSYGKFGSCHSTSTAVPWCSLS